MESETDSPDIDINHMLIIFGWSGFCLSPIVAKESQANWRTFAVGNAMISITDKPVSGKHLSSPRR